MKRLRRVLGDADRARIVTRSPGYVIRVDPRELDVARFELLLEGALAVYQHARRVVVDELGAEPGAELRELHRQILITGPVRASPESGQLPPGGGRPAGVRPGPVVPRELPGPVPQFVGRTAELADLIGMLEPASAQRPRTLVISAIAGMAGVGKTALAMQWAHQVADRFPDGQLHVNLRGYHSGRVPAQPGSGRAGCPGRDRRACGTVPEPAGGPADADHDR